MSVDALRSELQMIAQGAEWHGFNFAFDAEPDEETLADALADFMGVYCQTGALLAADWYNTREKETTFHASPVSVVPPERATDTARWVFRGAQTPEGIAKRVASAAYTMVFDAARDTVSANATNEGVAVARVEERGACPDCRGRATMHPKARTSSSEDVSWERHQRCEFLFEPVRTGIWTPPRHHEEWRASNGNSRLLAPGLSGH